ncbi:MAG TPA: hypothetical protein PK867_31140, partial [Pirellulales bacterium]|nr:hypothetical protein [Pirellulales bacterium]
MTSVFDEDHLRFEFDDSWRVVKYDAHRDYLQGIQMLDETKAVDFVALRVVTGAESEMFWIEVKDFRGYRIQNKRRQADGELALEVAQKVRDSLAGVIGALQTSSTPEDWQPFVERMRRREPPMRIVLWLEDDPPPPGSARRKTGENVQAQLLKQRLKWLTTKILVHSLKGVSPPEG